MADIAPSRLFATTWVEPVGSGCDPANQKMKTQAFFINLTERPPRSFRLRLGGFVVLARMLDKGRATLAKKNGEYNYNSPTDQHLVQFLNFDADALLKELAAGKGDGEILQWVVTNAKIARTP